MFSNNPYVVMFRLYWRFVQNKPKAILFMLFQTGARMVQLAGPWFFAQILNTIQTGGEEMWTYLGRYMGGLLLSPLIEWAFHGPSRVREHQVAFEAAKSYQLYLYHCAIYLPLAWHTDNHSGATIDRINNARKALLDFGESIFSSLGTFISLIGALIALVWIWPRLGLFFLVLGAMIVWLITQFDKQIVALNKAKNTVGHQIGGLLVDYLTNIKTLITLRFLQPTEQNLATLNETFYSPYIKAVIKGERKWFTTDALIQMMLIMIVGIYMWHSRSTTGLITVGTITMIYQYSERVSSTFYNMARRYSKVLSQMTDTQSVEIIEQAYADHTQRQNSVLLGDWKQLDIQHLTFTYQDDKKVLSDISLRIARGERIALVGESGSGKSTLLTILRGLYHPQHVSLTIDGQHYDMLDPIHDTTSLIPQEPEIFEETIHFNITMGSDLDEEVIQKYSKIAMFHDVAKKLPSGYDTHIKEKGINLSGGQKQRLALARGLLASSDSQIILLDESTSSVDSINEKKIYQNIFREFEDKTIIAAIHKLHLLPMFDMIYMFDQGEIIEAGSFQELVDLPNGRFAQLWEEYQIQSE